MVAHCLPRAAPTQLCHEPQYNSCENGPSSGNKNNLCDCLMVEPDRLLSTSCLKRHLLLFCKIRQEWLALLLAPYGTTRLLLDSRSRFFALYSAGSQDTDGCRLSRAGPPGGPLLQKLVDCKWSVATVWLAQLKFATCIILVSAKNRIHARNEVYRLYKYLRGVCHRGLLIDCGSSSQHVLHKETCVFGPY